MISHFNLAAKARDTGGHRFSKRFPWHVRVPSTPHSDEPTPPRRDSTPGISVRAGHAPHLFAQARGADPPAANRAKTIRKHVFSQRPKGAPAVQQLIQQLGGTNIPSCNFSPSTDMTSPGGARSYITSCNRPTRHRHIISEPSTAETVQSVFSLAQSSANTA